MELTPRLRLMNWLVSQGLTGLPENDLIRGFCERCRAEGLDLSRGLVFIDTLHPILEGRGFRWNDTEANESDAFEYGSTNEGDAAQNVIDAQRGGRFTLTRKDFKTPLGVARTDQRYLDRLVRHYGDGLFDDELAHLPEHSIELEVVLLQYLYEGRRPIRIVPLVVGSFQDCIAAECPPESQDDIRRMIDALRNVEAETKEPICYVISGDLAHIGPKFAAPEPVSDELLSHSKNQDQAILCQAEAADPARYFRIVADELDERAICGYPPTYIVLEATQPRRGKVLHYDKVVEETGFESVSFASVGFYR